MTWDEQGPPFDAELEAQKKAIFNLYFQARCALTYKETFGRDLPGVLEGPDWLRERPLDETVLAVLRSELIEVFNRSRPPEGWAYPHGSPPGDSDWLRLPDDPENLVRWIDENAKVRIGEMAAEILRDVLKGRRRDDDTTKSGADE